MGTSARIANKLSAKIIRRLNFLLDPGDQTHFRMGLSSQTGCGACAEDAFNLASKILSHSICPFLSILIREYLRNTSTLQSIDGQSEIFSTALGLDILNRVKVRMEGKDNSIRRWKTMKGLALAPEESLYTC